MACLDTINYGLFMKHPALIGLKAYWDSLRNGDQPPSKRSFDVLGLPTEIWPRLFMIDKLANKPDFRIRILGSYLVAAYGQDFKGKLLTDDEIPCITNSITYHLLGNVLKNRDSEYYFGRTDFRFTSQYAETEQILLPLVCEQGLVSVIVGAIDFPGFQSKKPDIISLVTKVT